jgi:hypothetical protein
VPEYIRPGEWRTAALGAMLDDNLVRRDLFYLTGLFLASRPVNALAVDPEHNKIPELWNEFIEQEICLRLATTAPIIRARDDMLLREARAVKDPQAKAEHYEFRK